MNDHPSFASKQVLGGLLLAGVMLLAAHRLTGPPAPLPPPAGLSATPPAVAPRGARPAAALRTAVSRPRRWVVADTAPRSAANASRAIPEEWVVILRPGADAAALAARVGAEVVGGIGAARTYRLRFPNAAAAQAAEPLLRNDGAVAGMDRNYALPRPAPPQWAEAADAPPALGLEPVAADAPIVIGLVDSAVGAQGTAADGFLLHPSTDAPAEPTHGTAVLAAILEGLSAGLGEDNKSTGVKIVPVDVYGGAEETSSFQVAEGMLAALEQGATIVNLSLGGSEPESLMRNIIASGDNLGVVFVGAAGNEPVTTPTYPAAYDPVLAVTSVDANGAVDAQANRGDFVDVGAPGTVRFPYGDRWYETSGTSVSAGYISGLTAGLAERLQVPVADAATLVSERLALTAPPAAP